MGISASIFLIAVGAVLAFAVDATVEGLDIVTVGWILIAAGAIGVLFSLTAWESWGGFGRSTTVRSHRAVDARVVDDVPLTGRSRTVYRRDDIVP